MENSKEKKNRQIVNYDISASVDLVFIYFARGGKGGSRGGGDTFGVEGGTPFIEQTRVQVSTLPVNVLYLPQFQLKKNPQLLPRVLPLFLF